MRKILTGLLVLTSISAFADDSTLVRWKNKYKAADGTIWSDILPKQYANCITKKNYQRQPDDWYNDNCEKDLDGEFVGTDTKEEKIIDSDAIRACKAIGGELPSVKDYHVIGVSYGNSEWVKMPNMEYKAFWTTDSTNYKNSDANTFGGTRGLIFQADRSQTSDVRCIRKPKH